MYNSKSEPNVNYGLWVMMKCQCRLIGSNEWPSLVGGVNSMGGWALCVESDAMWKILCTFC